MEKETQMILEPGEQVVWEGKINRKVLMFGLITGLIIFGIIAAILFMKESIHFETKGKPEGTDIKGWVAGSVILGVSYLLILWNYFSKIVREYVVTKKRVLFKSGLIGTDFKSVYYDQIQNVIVDVGLIGKIFKVGTVKIDTGKTETYSTGGHAGGSRSSMNIGGLRTGGGRTGQIRTRTVYDMLLHIDKPYEVYQYVQSSLSSRKESLYSGRADAESQQAREAAQQNAVTQLGQQTAPMPPAAETPMAPQPPAQEPQPPAQ
jgi:uncharacterized membrane protein YdbT with pleckstrin-like domain